MGRGAWQALLLRVAKNQTQLKQLNMYLLQFEGFYWEDTRWMSNKIGLWTRFAHRPPVFFLVLILTFSSHNSFSVEKDFLGLFFPWEEMACLVDVNGWWWRRIQHGNISFFFLIQLISKNHLFIWLHWVFVLACSIFIVSHGTFSCGSLTLQLRLTGSLVVARWLQPRAGRLL